MIHILVHFLGVTNFGVVIWQRMSDTQIPPEALGKLEEMGTLKFGGNWKYLTFWNLWLQLAYFTLCLLNDLMGRKGSKRSGLRKLEDNFFASLAFPIGMFVGLIFWGLYLVNRELVYPEILDKLIPVWANHLMHTTVLPLQLFEMVAIHHVYPSTLKGSMATTAFNMIYLTWTLYVAYVGGFWVYPILEVLPPVQRAVFIGLVSLFGAVLFLLGKLANSLIWGEESQSKARTQPKARANQKSRPKKFV